MPKKRHVTRKNKTHPKKKHDKKTHHNKRKVAGVNEQDRIRNENRVRELNQQISQLMERIHRLQRGTPMTQETQTFSSRHMPLLSGDDQSRINIMTERIRERIRRLILRGRSVANIRESLRNDGLLDFPGVEDMLR